MAGDDVDVRAGVEQDPLPLPLHWQPDLRLATVGTHRVHLGDLTTSQIIRSPVEISILMNGGRAEGEKKKFPQKYKLS